MHSCFALSGLTVSGLFSDGLHALSLDLSTRREHRKKFFFQGTSEFYVHNSNMSKYTRAKKHQGPNTPNPNASKIKENLYHKLRKLKTKMVNSAKPFHVMLDLARYIDVCPQYHACMLSRVCALVS